MVGAERWACIRSQLNNRRTMKTEFTIICLGLLGMILPATSHLRAESQAQPNLLSFTDATHHVSGEMLSTNRIWLKFERTESKPVSIELTQPCRLHLSSSTSGARVFMISDSGSKSPTYIGGMRDFPRRSTNGALVFQPVDSSPKSPSHTGGLHAAPSDSTNGALVFQPVDANFESDTHTGGLRVVVEFSGQRCLDVTADLMRLEYLPKTDAK